MGTHLKILFAAFALSSLAIPAWAQQSAPASLDDAITGYESATHESFQGVPTDWSARHMVFSNPAPGSDEEDSVQQSPRYWQQQIRRTRAASDSASVDDASAEVDTDAASQGGLDSKSKKQKKNKKKKKKGSLTSDWSVYLGPSGATAGTNNFPAKFGFNSSTTSCSDYVVYNTSAAGLAAVSAGGSGAFNLGGLGTPAGSVTITNGANSIVLTTSATLNTNANFQCTNNNTTCATNLAAAINRNNTNLIGVTATSATATVTMTAAIPGNAGNSITITNTLTNFFGLNSVFNGGTQITLAGGTDGQANILAFDKLYKPACNSGTPNTAWAYNLPTGSVVTSPIISLNGSQVAFAIGTGPASLGILNPRSDAVTHTIIDGTTSGTTTVTGPSGSFSSTDVGALITGTFMPSNTTITAISGTTSATISTAATGTIAGTGGFTVVAPSVTAPAPLAALSNTNYRTCITTNTVPCYFAAGLSGGVTHNDTNSSPYYDYSPGVDNLYVGDDVGILHKFNPVFLGAPAEVLTNWPATILASRKLTSPVLDVVTQKVFVGTAANGASGGTIASVNGGATPGTPTTTSQLDNGLGFVDSPIVDGSAGKLYAFSPKNGVYQLTASTLAASAATAVGTGSSTVPLYAGTFDNAYFNSSVFTGSLYVCGNPGGTAPGPTVYQVKITTNAIVSSTAGPIVSAANTPCSAVTEVFNSPADWLFLSAVTETSASLPTGCSNGVGCVAAYDAHTGAAVFSSAHSEAGGTSGISIDNVLGTTGNSQVYFSTLTGGTCTTSNLTGGCAVQAAQSGLGQ